MKAGSHRVVYGGLALIWLVAGLCIWQFSTGILRFYGGDVLVSGFLFWCILWARPASEPFAVSLLVFFVATCVETMQVLNLDKLRALLGREASSLIIGSNFDWIDLVAYALGLVASILIHRWIPRLMPAE